jgi:hypothetical protein
MAAAVAPSLVRRDPGVALRLLPFAVGALLLTVVAPLWLLLLSPLLLGVPHVVADVRYLLLDERALPRRRAALLLAPLAILTGLRLAAVLGAPGRPRLEVLLGLGAVAAALAGAGAATTRRWIAGGLLAAGGLAAFTWPRHVALALGHLHNLIALGLWLAWARASSRQIAAAALLLVACGAALAGGVFDGLTLRTGGLASAAAGLDLAAMGDALAPGLRPEVVVPVVQLFAFAQALHYAVWLVLLPAAREGASRRPWLWALKEDLGPHGLMVAALLTLAVPAAGLIDPAGTRNVYLSLVLFHGWLEVAVIARWAAGRAAPWSR